MGFSHHLVIDLGQPRNLRQTDLGFRFKETEPGRIVINRASGSEEPIQPLGQMEFSDFHARVAAQLNEGGRFDE